MKIMKNRRFIVLTVLILVVSLIGETLGNNTLSARAYDTLPGVKEVVTQKAINAEKYRILEIVPDKSLAQIGYYISGQEPVNYKSALAGVVSQDTSPNANKLTRQAYMTALVNSFGTNISANKADNTPLTYTQYQEKTSLTDSEKASGAWNTLVLSRTEVQRVNGYYKPNSSGTGDYIKTVSGGQYQYVGKNGDFGTSQKYSENIISFTKNANSSSRYSVVFKFSNYSYANEAGYTADSRVITDWSSLADNMCVYTKDGTFQYAGTAGDIKKTAGYQSKTYYQVVFTYSDNIVEANKYVVDSYNYSTAGEYYSVLDKNEPYIVSDNGEFKCTNAGTATYSYSAGKGRYDWAEDLSGSQYDVTVGTVYYTGGIVNNDWFKKYVFDFSPTELSTMNIEVKTVTPAELNNTELSQYDMFYISNKSSATYKYSTSNDISWNTAVAFFKNIVQTKKPCIFDSSLLSAGYNQTVMYNLAVMLSQNDTTAFYNKYFSGTAYPAMNSINWSTAAGSVVQDTDKYFVKNNICSNKNDGIFSRNFNAVFDKTTVADGFSDIVSLINTENLYRQADTSKNYPPISTDVSQAVAVKYIINFANPRNVANKTSFRILEVQPTASFELTSDIVKKWLGQSGNSAATVTIDQMSTAQLVGKIDDLNSTYDLIYFGTSKGLLNINTSKTSTAFNDTNMNGLVYFHVGDISTCSNDLGGLLNNEYPNQDRTKVPNTSTYRYSGNDITKDKYSKLMNFINAKYPVVFSDEFFSGNAVNGSLIDNSSYIYKFAKDTLLSNNVFRKSVSDNSLSQNSAIGSSVPSSTLFAFYINRPKLSIVQDKSAQTIDSANGSVIITPKADGNNYLEYSFNIRNDGAAASDMLYKCSLYIDINADGKFSPNETVDQIEIRDASGTIVDPDELYADTQYFLKRKVSGEYTSVMPWNLSIAQANNPYIETSVKGYSVLKNAPRNVLNILQINSEIYSPTLNLQNEMKNTSSNFYKAINDPAVKNRFDINIKTITCSQYIASYKNNNNYLSDYNMLIIGFGDGYGELSDKDSVCGKGGILDFINSGKSVLFTHDTTSYVNATNRAGMSSWNFGYNFNTYIRNVVGMDRFGVTNSDILKAGLPLNSTMTSQWNRLINSSKDIAYVAKSNMLNSYAQVHGYTNFCINTYKNTSQNGLYNISNVGGKSRDSSQAVKINDGQITSYPFKIPDNLTVASTHPQYYQLDLDADDDKDGESDIVVWYTLDGGSGTLYPSSPKDVVNNYYIYNKGNVTYSGVGHSKVTGIDEFKLFVNTMIASYNSGLKPPSISFQENSGADSRIINSVTVTYDQLINSKPVFQDNVPVYFNVSDVNFIKGTKNINVKYYIKNDSGTSTINVDGNDIKVIPFSPQVKNVSLNSTVNANVLASGDTYTFNIPTSNLPLSQNTYQIYVEVQCEINSYSTTKVTGKNYGVLNIIKEEMFNLS